MDDRRTSTWSLVPFLLIGVAICLLPGCGPKDGVTPRPRPLQGLFVVCEPKDALIYVNDRYLGSVKGLDRQPLMLPEGDHRLEIQKDGYFSHFAEVRLVKGMRQQVTVKLRKEPY